MSRERVKRFRFVAGRPRFNFEQLPGDVRVAMIGLGVANYGAVNLTAAARSNETAGTVYQLPPNGPAVAGHSDCTLQCLRRLPSRNNRLTLMFFEEKECSIEATGVSDADKLRKQVATLASFGAHALRSSQVEELLQETTRLVSDAIEVDLVKVLELLPDGQNLLVRAGVNWHPGVVGHATIPAGEGSAAGYALQANTPVISNAATEKRFRTPQLLLEHEVKSTVNVVIRGEGAPFGVLEVDSREHRSFGQDDIAFLQNYANLLASAIDRLDNQRDMAGSVKKQDLLLHELQHRVNNMLMTIRAVARLTRAKSTSLDDFAGALDNRLTALARSHALLSEPGNANVGVREILKRELSAQGAVEGENLQYHGPDVLLSSKQVHVLVMLFHELATNAVKHGALSVASGRVEVTCSVDRGEQGVHVRLQWRERGVMIEREPAKRGYGSEFLEKSVLDLLDGAFQRTFHADGVECVIQFRIEPPNVSTDDQHRGMRAVRVS